MKKVYLRNSEYEWQAFEYEGNIQDGLKDLLAERKISIGYRASIGDGASIGNGASIGDGASIGNGASIGYRASIGDDVKLLTGIYFFGTNHPVTYVGEGKISIGCHCYPIEKWQKSFKTIGKKECYSEEQIKEYGAYIALIAEYYKALIAKPEPLSNAA